MIPPTPKLMHYKKYVPQNAMIDQNVCVPQSHAIKHNIPFQGQERHSTQNSKSNLSLPPGIIK